MAVHCCTMRLSAVEWLSVGTSFNALFLSHLSEYHQNQSYIVIPPLQFNIASVRSCKIFLDRTLSMHTAELCARCVA